MRSASDAPQTILPLSEPTARPALNTVTAAIAVMPRSDGIGHHVEDRARVRRAAREVGERDGGELRRAERLRRREHAPPDAGVRRGGDPAAAAAGSRTKNAAGMMTSQAILPSTSMAMRQS